MRQFNTAGPVRPSEHYCVSSLERLGVAELLNLIRAEQYFVLYAPRQTGKTSVLCGVRDVKDYRIRAGHLVIFDMREGGTWAEKIYREERSRDGAAITVWGA